MANSGYSCQICAFSPSENDSFDPVQRAEMSTAVVSANVGPGVVLGVIWALGFLLPSQVQGMRCEPLTIPLCQGLGYNHTIFPNTLNHTSQQEAALEVHQFTALVRVGCSRDLAFSICSVYAPYCAVSANLTFPVPPCRFLCSRAKKDCAGLMKRFGFAWPASLRCNRFPKLGEEKCVDFDSTSKTVTVQLPKVDRIKRGKTLLELLNIVLLSNANSFSGKNMPDV